MNFIKLKKLVNEKTFNRILVGVVTVSLVFGIGGRLYVPAEASVAPGMNPGGVPDYFGTVPNYANSPLPEVDASGNVIPGTGIRKFVDSLPGLGAANANNLGNYLPVGVPDTTSYPGSDYYEINLVEYSQKLHSDLPATKLRGYVQVNTTDPTVSKPSYMGPVIVAQKDRPVRIKFTNKLPIGEAGDLFLPVDTTLMGAGMGPNGVDMYTQNRATLHLHGGITPWISDGSPHQWITPAGENTPYPTGVSVKNVPDMPDPGPGSMTFFYSNQQSARLMFYHDHSYGLTRLNVYAGEAAGYMIKDDAEKALIASGDIPSDEIPLIIQDKTFVPNDTQLAKEDPTWDTAKWGGMGNLWFPHVYMPNQNPYDNSGANPMGRWDYGPWFWPPYTGLQYGPVANPLAGINGEPPMNPGVPNVSIVPESFLDTPVINGAAYPYLDVQPKPYRFKILNAANDRFFNLQLYIAKSNNQMWNANGALADADAGEVNMVDAVKTAGYPATWPTDGRDGGVPDPASVGPNIVQIGTEGGFLTTPAVLPNQPIDYVYNRRDIIVLSVSSKTLLMGPAERADVVIDFSKYAGKTLILYNDSPAPVPAFDPRNDYYTGDPDQTESGGAPTTLPGYGPNTRTIMQIKVAAAPAPGYKLSDIKVTNAGTGYTSPAVTIDAPVATAGVKTETATAKVLSAVDAITTNNAGSGYTNAPQVTLTGGGATTPATAKSTIKIANIAISNPGVGYRTAPAVTIVDSAGGTGTGAIAKASLSLTGISLATPGAGYTSVPTVAITDSAGGTGSGAYATATIDPASGAVTGISLTSPGMGYTTPIVTITGGGASTNATATVLGTLDNILLTSSGTGYTTPIISITGGGATTNGAAVITNVVDKIVITSPGVSYTSAPTVAISGGGATTNATATATLKISAINLINEGKGYLASPAVHITDITGTGALATAILGEPLALLNKSIPLAFKSSQNPLIVPDGTYVRIQDTSLKFTPPGTSTQLSLPLGSKAIQELFTMDYGRMNATLGVELPNTNIRNQTTIPLGYLDPPTEVLQDSITPMSPVAGDGTQIWKITHNGVDTHAIHFHLFDVQLINRVGWDGAIRKPDANEMGWKDTVRMNPLEDCIVAFRPVAPKVNFGVPDSIRPLDPTAPLGTTTQFTGIDPTTGNPKVVTNTIMNFGWEYLWHCHLLGHEENDMMRAMVLNVARSLAIAPVVTFTRTAAPVILNWTDGTPGNAPSSLGNPASEIGFNIERSTIGSNGKPGTYAKVGSALANQTSYTDISASSTTSYSYRVIAFNAAGNSISTPITVSSPPSAPTGLVASVQTGPKVNLTFTDTATNETGFSIQRAVNGGAFTVLATLGSHNNTGSVYYTDASVTKGSTYDYRVVAVKGTLLSAYSNTVSVTIPTTPVAPSSLAAIAIAAGSKANVTLTWVDNSNNETSFLLQRADNSAFTNNKNNSTIAPNIMTIQQTGLSRGKTYYYRLQAVNQSGVSSWSNVVVVITP